MTKAKEAFDDFNDNNIPDEPDDNTLYSCDCHGDTVKTIRKALELLDKVDSGGVDIRGIPELQTLDDDEFATIAVSYILIERDNV